MSDLEKYVKTLQMKRGTILVIDCNKINVEQVAMLRLNIDHPVPILAVDGAPSIERFTREELAEALRLIDEGGGK